MDGLPPVAPKLLLVPFALALGFACSSSSAPSRFMNTGGTSSGTGQGGAAGSIVITTGNGGTGIVGNPDGGNQGGMGGSGVGDPIPDPCMHEGDWPHA